jgi:hypothetical protein
LNHASNDTLADGCNFDTDPVDTYPDDPLNTGARSPDVVWIAPGWPSVTPLAL